MMGGNFFAVSNFPHIYSSRAVEIHAVWGVSMKTRRTGLFSILHFLIRTLLYMGMTGNYRKREQTVISRRSNFGESSLTDVWHTWKVQIHIQI